MSLNAHPSPAGSDFAALASTTSTWRLRRSQKPRSWSGSETLSSSAYSLKSGKMNTGRAGQFPLFRPSALPLF